MVEHSPKALVCTGSGFKRAFLIAFADSIEQVLEDKDILEVKVGGSKGKGKTVEWLHINGGKTLLVITPFLGPGGLMSDASLVDLARLLREKARG